MKPSKLKIKVTSTGIVESILLNGENLVEKYMIQEATYSIVPDRLPTLRLEIVCDEVEHDGPLDVDVDDGQ